MFSKEIKAIADLVSSQDATVQKIILTHHHWDHILGPEHFPGVSVVAQANYLTEVSQRSAYIEQMISDWEARPKMESEQGFVAPHPNEVFEDSITLVIGGMPLHLVHAPGHTTDHLVAYHAESGTLWAADMLDDLLVPHASELAAYKQTLATLSKWDIRVLVPAHGSPTTDTEEIRARILKDMTYLGELENRVKHAIRQGKTVEQTGKECRDMVSRYPAWNDRPHRLNVESAYLEFGGAASPAQVGWDKQLYEER